MKEYKCPYCGGIMYDYDDSVRFACRYCKKDVKGWEKEFHEKLIEALQEKLPEERQG